MAGTLLLALATQERAMWDSVAWSIGFGHYAMALALSLAPLRARADASRAASFAGLLVLGPLLYLSGFSIAIYFGIHHVLNEVYMLDRVTSDAERPAVRRLRLAGLALHAALYVFLVRREHAFMRLPALPIEAVLLAAYAVFALAFAAARRALRPAEWLANGVFEAAALVLVLRGVHFTTLEVATYHFTFWIGFPLLAPGAARRSSGWYVLATLALSALWLLLSPIGVPGLRLSSQAFLELVLVLSFVHITLSFGLSRANPRWLRAWFLTPARGWPALQIAGGIAGPSSAQRRSGRAAQRR